MGTQDWIWQPFLGREGGGGAKFRAVPNQANQQHVQNGALRLRGIWIRKKKTKLNLGQPILYRFIFCICFLGGLNL